MDTMSDEERKVLETMLLNAKKNAKYWVERQEILERLLTEGTNGQKTLDLKTDNRRTGTISGQIIDAAVKLIEVRKRPVQQAEIVKHLDDIGLEFGSPGTNKTSYVGAVLSSELDRDHPRIRRTKDGEYDILK